jgi:integrase
MRKNMPAYKYTLSDGRTLWYSLFYYTDWTGKKKRMCKRGFKTQREAKEYERSFLEKEENQASDIMFSSLVENYLSDMANRLKPTTMENKENIIKTKILPYFLNLKVCDIDTLKIRKWQNELLSYRNEDGMPYSQTYLKTIHNQMSAMMNYASKHYGLLQNPCHVAGSIGKSHAEEMRFWTKEQYDIFASSITKSAYKLAFDILFYTGIREGELLALTPADVLPDRKLDINKNFAKIKGEALFLIPKTSKSRRTITIPEFLYNDIQNYISKLYGIEPSDRIFHFTKSGLYAELKAGIARTGLPEIRVHDLRHSHASMLIHLNFDIKGISERLGHDSVKTTWDTYAHLYPGADRAISDKLDQLKS